MCRMAIEKCLIILRSFVITPRRPLRDNSRNASVSSTSAQDLLSVGEGENYQTVTVFDNMDNNRNASISSTSAQDVFLAEGGEKNQTVTVLGNMILSINLCIK